MVANLATGTAFRLSDDSPWTLGLGIFGLVGGGVNFAGSSSQPLLTPRNPPETFGVGPIYSSLSTLEITPIASYQATDKLAIAAGPIITATAASFSPGLLRPEPKGPVRPRELPGRDQQPAVLGRRVPVRPALQHQRELELRLLVQEPDLAGAVELQLVGADGSARYIGVQASLPEIISWGVAYKGLPNTLIDVDLRYFDYKDTSLFGQSIQNGGLGWRSVFAVATGVQYQRLRQAHRPRGLSLQHQPDPFGGHAVQRPGPGDHHEYPVASEPRIKLTADITAQSLMSTGSATRSPGGVEQLPGASTRLDTQTDSLVVGLNIQFGRSRKGGTSSSVRGVRACQVPRTPMPPAPSPVVMDATSFEHAGDRQPRGDGPAGAIQR